MREANFAAFGNKRALSKAHTSRDSEPRDAGDARAVPINEKGMREREREKEMTRLMILAGDVTALADR